MVTLGAPLQSHIPAGEALHAITLEKCSFLLENQRTKLSYLRTHLVCELKESLQHGLEGLLNKKPKIFCWTSTPFILLLPNERQMTGTGKLSLL